MVEVCSPQVLFVVYIVLRHIWVYLNEQVTSKTELDQKPEHHACEHQFNDAPNASDSCVSSILNLNVTVCLAYRIE